MHRILLLIHVLAGMAWVGGGFVIQVTSQLALRAKGVGAATRVMASFRWADTWLAIGAPILVVATGVTTVVMSGAGRRSDLGLAFPGAGRGLRSHRRNHRRTAVSNSRDHHAGDQLDLQRRATRLYGRFMRFGMALLLVLIALVVLMVYELGV